MMDAFLNGIVWFFILPPFVLALFLVPWSVADAKLAIGFARRRSLLTLGVISMACLSAGQYRPHKA